MYTNAYAHTQHTHTHTVLITLTGPAPSPGESPPASLTQRSEDTKPGPFGELEVWVLFLTRPSRQCTTREGWGSQDGAPSLVFSFSPRAEGGLRQGQPQLFVAGQRPKTGTGRDLDKAATVCLGGSLMEQPERAGVCTAAAGKHGLSGLWALNLTPPRCPGLPTAFPGSQPWA